MKNLISIKLAANLLLVFFSALTIFHVLILLNLLPSNLVWGGGNLSSNLHILETVSLVLTLFFAMVVAAKVEYIKVTKFKRAVHYCLWFMFVYMLLNTLGNLASSSLTEKLIFTPLTILASVLVLRLAIEK